MKKQSIQNWSKKFALTNLMVVTYVFVANAQVSKATAEFTKEATAAQSAMQKGLLALAGLCAAIALIGVFQKSSGENENAGKHYMKWFTAAGLFALAWGSMAWFFAGN